MSTKTAHRESQLLREARRWRREAYELRKGETAEQRTARLQRLAAEFGLQKHATNPTSAGTANETGHK